MEKEIKMSILIPERFKAMTQNYADIIITKEEEKND